MVQTNCVIYTYMLSIKEQQKIFLDVQDSEFDTYGIDLMASKYVQPVKLESVYTPI